MLRLTGAVLFAVLSLAAPSIAADTPAEIKIGTLYASAGRFASISMPVYSALKLWADQKNAEGGVYVKAFDKKLPVKLVAYDDQSNTATASTLYKSACDPGQGGPAGCGFRLGADGACGCDCA
jgi:branched-chain amino acid transport system substrate-binding protein